MQLRHALALLLLVVTPLIVIGWLGSAAVRRQQTSAEEQLRGILTDRLLETDLKLTQVTRRYSETLGGKLRVAGRDTQLLKKLRQTEPAVQAVLLVDRDGRLVYPPRPSSENSAAMSWHGAMTALARRRPIGNGAESLDKKDSATVQSPPTKRTVKGSVKQNTVPAQWQSWYHENGLQLVLWIPRGDQTATGVILERGRWMADLIETLPDSYSDDSSQASKTYRSSNWQPVRSSFFLSNSAGETIYRWGSRFDETKEQETLAEIPLSPPLSAWKLAYQGTPAMTAGWAGGVVPLVASLAAIAVTMLLLGIYVMTSMRRQMTMAQQRVDFASHVSHELRTPLTNIRLYAELAQRDLQKIAEAPAKDEVNARIHVIEEESQRLSRLVSGVLDLVSSGRKTDRLRLQPAVPDELINQVLDSFHPALERLGYEVVCDLRAIKEVMLDTDLVELILVNLLSNVEKYGQSGRYLRLASSQTESKTIIDVVDRGPGIRRSAMKRIFEPFERLDDSLEAPAGTGLGLAIARGGARRLGGDLTVVPSSQGAHFRLTLVHET